MPAAGPDSCSSPWTVRTLRPRVVMFSSMNPQPRAGIRTGVLDMTGLHVTRQKGADDTAQILDFRHRGLHLVGMHMACVTEPVPGHRSTISSRARRARKAAIRADNCSRSWKWRSTRCPRDERGPCSRSKIGIGVRRRGSRRCACSTLLGSPMPMATGFTRAREFWASLTASIRQRQRQVGHYA